MSIPATHSPRPGSLVVPTQSPAALEHRPAAARWGDSPAAWLLLLVPVLIFLVEPFFIGHETVGRGTAFRDAPMGLVIGLAGLWMAITLGRHVIPAALVGISGVGLLLGAVLAPHAHVGVTATEAFCGVFAVVVAAIVVGQSSSEVRR